MSFIADFHCHSRFSRATSKYSDLEHFDFWGGIKGVSVVGTGDCTHPAWLKEIGEKLAPVGKGLFQLKPEFKIPYPFPPVASLDQVRFMLTGEISNIYKSGGKTRKVHNLICLPSLDAASSLSRKLAALGNIHSDGRPILGLDARDLLEILLDISPDAMLIPAHIWTPWFSVLGSKSGFDSIEACYRDMSPHVFAVETGLSSDPEMNRMVSQLDRYTLISNSDAHSAPNIGREANRFDCEMAFSAIADALQSRNNKRFLGTLEFFPEKGKYHYDGHRKCGVCLSPAESGQCGNTCPVCRKPLTIGVLNRVLELADRPQAPPFRNPVPFKTMLSLESILMEILGNKTAGVKVKNNYQQLIRRLGPELNIVLDVPLDEIRKQGTDVLAEAVKRLRKGQVKRHPGFDGQYGEVYLFDDAEKREWRKPDSGERSSDRI